MTESLKHLYLLDPEVIYLNHGSFGACPKPVFETYQRWQFELERNPVRYFTRQGELLLEARVRLAEYLHADLDGLVYFPNPTTALNMAIKSLDLKPGDEILTTDHEYPAMDRTWDTMSETKGIVYKHMPMPVPVRSKEEVIDALFAGLTERTKVLFLSHVTCFSAITLPLKEIIARGRSLGLVTIVDGAHAPGQVSLDLQAIDADVYVGACHKWMSAPKGAAFMAAAPRARSWLEPLVISLGGKPGSDGEWPSFADIHQFQGTRDLAAFLSVPAAIDFQHEHNWPAVQARCHALASEIRQQVEAITGLESFCPDSPEWYGQMVSIRLPEMDLSELGRNLTEDRHIVIPLLRLNGVPLVRVSINAYNVVSDADSLYEGVVQCLPQVLKVD